MATALVLAGNSFVGQHLVRNLRQGGHHVVVTARIPRPGLIPCDLTNPRQVEAVIAASRASWIIHCAGAPANVPRADMDRLHVDGTLGLLRAIARQVPESAVLLFGSAAEYGNVEPAALPVCEEYPGRPDSAFGQSKLAQLQAARQAAADFKLRILVVRPFNILGPGLPEHYVAGALARRLLQALAANRTGLFSVANGHATRDWVHVRDVVDAVVGLLSQAVPPPGEVGLYNIATGLETPVLALADKMCRLAGPFQAVPGDTESSRSGIIRSCGDSSRLRKTIGWRPCFSWQQCVEDLWRAAANPSCPGFECA